MVPVSSIPNLSPISTSTHRLRPSACFHPATGHISYCGSKVWHFRPVRRSAVRSAWKPGASQWPLAGEIEPPMVSGADELREHQENLLTQGFGEWRFETEVC